MGRKVKKKPVFLELLLLLTGQYALVKILEEVPVLRWDSTWGLGLGLMALSILWGLYRLPGRGPLLTALGVIGLGSLWLLLGNKTLQGQLTRMLESFGGNAAGEVTAAMTLLLLWAAVVLFLVEIVLNLHWPLLLAGAALPLACPFLGIPLHLPGIFALGVFLLGFWVWKRLKNPALPDKKANRSFQRLGVGVLAGVWGLFALSWLAAEAAQQTLYALPYQVEAMVVKAVRQQAGSTLDLEDGIVSRGNVYPAGVVLMELYAREKPEAAIYLRQSFRGDYENGQWGEDWEEEIITKMANGGVDWDTWSGKPETVLDTLVYQLVYRYGEREPQDLWVELKGKNTQRPRIYFSGGGQDMSGASYYPISQLSLPWDSISEKEPWNRELMGLYRQEAREYYTRLPATGLTKFRQLVNANPLESLEEVTMFIHHTLTTYADYTQVPGMFPLNQDPAEYFLFESGKGYCQHFATAAVILYRMYGIPARYATGYAVKPSDFTLELGEYHGVVTDESAHAWVEIFLPDYGWTPVEMTPGGETIPELPGISPQSLQEVLDSQNWDFSLLRHLEPEQPQTRPEWNPTQSQSQEKTWNLLPLLWAGLGAVILLGAYLGRRWFLARQSQLPPRMLFARLVEGLHFAGLLTGCDGQEADFGTQLAAVLPELQKRDIPQILSLVNRDAYSREPLPKVQRQAAWEFYQAAMALTAARLPWWKRWIFRYGKIFC